MSKKRKSWVGSSLRRDPVSMKLPLQSGYVVSVTPLPPYYKDIIDDALPMPEYPTRKVKLAAGDEVDWPYEPKPEHEDEGHEDHELWMRWTIAHNSIQKVQDKRVRARMDFLLSNCVDIIDGPSGPYEEDHEDGWVHRVEAVYPGYVVPTHPGLRRLVFLKTQVITSASEMELVLDLSTSAEVTMQGIVNALQGFQNSMGQGQIPGDNKQPAKIEGGT